MQIDAKTPEDYIDHIPENRKQAVSMIRKILPGNTFSLKIGRFEISK
jgi:hypothetical protein